jgi:hypothetical protein
MIIRIAEITAVKPLGTLSKYQFLQLYISNEYMKTVCDVAI